MQRMLTNTFVHTPGVGYSTEGRIWASGIRSWGDFLARPGVAGLGLRQTRTLEEHLVASLDRLNELDHEFFARFLPTREHWRVYSEFVGKLAYLDIETTGLGEEDLVTVIGLYDGAGMRAFVRGEASRERVVQTSRNREPHTRNSEHETRDYGAEVLPLEEFGEAVKPYGVLVTFFGSAFDLPFLRRDFGDLREGRIHLDLCYLMRRLGFSGGLKRIEQSLGIFRSEETSGLNGWDAVRLWAEYRRGSGEALELLLRYNQEDVENLQAVLWFAAQRLEEQCWARMGL